MRHISPKEMVSMLGSIPVARAIFRKPSKGVGVIVELRARNGEEITISEQGTPDPVEFSSPQVMDFFHELGFFSGNHDAVVLDARQYRPAGFGFLQDRGEMTFGEWRQRGEALDAAPIEEPPPNQFTTTVYTLDDAGTAGALQEHEIYGAQEGDEIHEEEAVEQKIGEKYLTTINLIRLTAAAVVVQLTMILLMPSVHAIRELVYASVGSMIILAVSFIFFERRQPDHPSLRIRRYVWLCLIVFMMAMTLSFVIGGKAMS